MRRSDRILTNFEDILDIISSCKVIRLAMIDGDRPYMVPLNFGVSVSGKDITFYFHSAREGRKLDVLRKNPHVYFEMDTDHQLVEGDGPCHTAFHYSCVMGDGTAEFLTGEQALLALSALVRHETGKEYVFTPEQAAKVAVFAVHVQSVSGKRWLPGKPTA